MGNILVVKKAIQEPRILELVFEEIRRQDEKNFRQFTTSKIECGRKTTWYPCSNQIRIVSQNKKALYLCKEHRIAYEDSLGKLVEVEVFGEVPKLESTLKVRPVAVGGKLMAQVRSGSCLNNLVIDEIPDGFQRGDEICIRVKKLVRRSEPCGCNRQFTSVYCCTLVQTATQTKPKLTREKQLALRE
jgi:hypothetical protein